MPPSTPSTAPGLDRTGFEDIETWIFDLDNTLYSATERMRRQTNQLMGKFVSDFLKVDSGEARRIQKAYFREFGLTLRGLIVNHGLDPARYRDHMAQTDLSEIAPDPALADSLGRLHGRKIIYTNAFSHHAEEVLERLGMAGLFDAVHHIEAADFLPKPAVDAYRALCRRHAISAKRAVMIDDIAGNLEPAAGIGMTTVWLKTDAEWAAGTGVADYVHHVIGDIIAWADSVAAPER